VPATPALLKHVASLAQQASIRILEFYPAPDFQTVAIPQRGRLQPIVHHYQRLRHGIVLPVAHRLGGPNRTIRALRAATTFVSDAGFAMVYGKSLPPRLFGSSNELQLFAPKNSVFSSSNTGSAPNCSILQKKFRLFVRI
jgi:hypothetical protein